MTQQVLDRFDPLRCPDIADPYPFYRRYREEDPIHRVPAAEPAMPDTWYVFRHDDVARALTHRDLGHGARGAAADIRTRPILPPGTGVLRSMVENWLVFMDPPQHTRLRALLGGAFSADAVNDLRPRIREGADHLVRDLRGRAAFDLVDRFAAPLPIAVVSRLLGVDDRLCQWLRKCAVAIQEASTSRVHRSADAYASAESAARQLDRFFRQALMQRRTEARDDMLTALVQAADRGEPLTEDEMVATCVHLLTAGHETTTNLISKATLALLAHPDVLSELCSNSELMPLAVEEFIRYDTPVQMISRWACQDAVLGGRHIRRGDKVVLVLGSANRDPRRYRDPDTLDIRRNISRHCGFGIGMHYCLGAGLARAEAEIALSALLEGLRRFRLGDEPVTYAADMVFHGPARLILRT
jgi:cytochrome P450 StaP